MDIQIGLAEIASGKFSDVLGNQADLATTKAKELIDNGLRETTLRSLRMIGQDEIGDTVVREAYLDCLAG